MRQFRGSSLKSARGSPLVYYKKKREERNMRKGLTEIIFILDRSGSMAGLEGDTIGGYNSMLDRQKKEDGEAIV